MRTKSTWNLLGWSCCAIFIQEGHRENTPLTMARAFKRFLPMFDRILVERNLPEVKTKGGIMIPEKAQGKVQEAVVVAVGGGARNESGSVDPVSVQVGDKVLLPEYGGTKIILEEKEYFLFRDGDLLGKFESQ